VFPAQCRTFTASGGARIVTNDLRSTNAITSTTRLALTRKYADIETAIASHVAGSEGGPTGSNRANTISATPMPSTNCPTLNATFCHAQRLARWPMRTPAATE
jgi:hypothetical protein